MTSEINWQTGDPLYEGWYLTTVKKGEHTFVTPNYYYPCDGWRDDDGEIIAFSICYEIQPYIEPTFRIGEFIVENGIVGIVTRVNHNRTYTVVGAALMEMTFQFDMCRLATSDEALSISAKLRERKMYYDIADNSFKNFNVNI